MRLLLVELLNAFFDLRKAGRKIELVTQKDQGTWGILRLIHEQECDTVSDLARHRGVSRQYIQKLCFDLRKQGLLTLSQSQLDKRSKKMKLTLEGVKALRKMNANLSTVSEMLARDFSATELAQSIDIVVRLRNRLRSFGNGSEV